MKQYRKLQYGVACLVLVAGVNLRADELPPGSIRIDFEEAGRKDISTESPYEGAQCLMVKGEGGEAFTFKKVMIPGLLPNTTYQIQFAMKKMPDVNPSGHENFAMPLDRIAGKVVNYGPLGKTVPPDGSWHIVKGLITTKEEVNEFSLAVYNKRTSGIVYIDEIVIRPVTK